ncbi:uncharacterized protein METZ01_LOCUS409430 [marine metagenome]|uniref:Uncharacterized protein n=1 Tax=marine metagenome TaxID=408172 RepID=A0A382WCF8_9ZZZZ
MEGLIGRERVDTLRTTLWPEFEAFISNAIQQAELRAGREKATGLKGAPDWRIIKRALQTFHPKKRQKSWTKLKKAQEAQSLPPGSGTTQFPVH